MLHTDPRFVESVTRVVGEIERTTAAELVVVAAGRSASHTGRGAACGVAAAWLALLLMVVLPIDFAAEWLLIELPILGGLVAWFVPRNEQVLQKVLLMRRISLNHH